MSSIESTVDHPVATDSDKPPTTPSNKRSSVSQQNLIYFEKQDGGALCATFALNNLLQGPFIDEIAMSNIAHEIYSRESEIMSASGVDSPDYLTFLAAGNPHADESGNFSIEVLNEALKLHHLSLVSIKQTTPQAKEAKEFPSDQQGFICNFKSHWLSLRRIDGSWFNLDSLQASGMPEPLTDTYLNIFLSTLTQKGYSVFVVLGSFPPFQPPPPYIEFNVQNMTGEGAANGIYYEKEYIIQSQLLNKSKKLKPNVPANNLQYDEEKQLELALALSMSAAAAPVTSPTHPSAPSAGPTHTIANSNGQSEAVEEEEPDEDEEAELAAAIALSLSQNPEQATEEQPNTEEVARS